MHPASPFYARDGLNARTYDARTAVDVVASGIAGDTEWYARKAIEWGGPVLEVACGTGRVTWGLGQAGLDAVGFDLSRAMLA